MTQKRQRTGKATLKNTVASDVGIAQHIASSVLARAAHQPQETPTHRHNVANGDTAKNQAIFGRVSAFAGSVHSAENQKLTVWLRACRTSQGLTMRELGQRLNIPHSYISKIEHQERRLDVVEFVRYCKALGIDPRVAFEQLL